VLFLPDDMYLRDYPAPEIPGGIAPAVPSRIPIKDKPINNAGVMPRFEKIAQSGAIFTRAFTSSPSCTPSRYSIMTGRYPSNSQYGWDQWSAYFPDVSKRFVDYHSQLGPGYSDTKKTVAFALSNVGYRTGMVGKWHLTPTEFTGFGKPYSEQVEFVKRAGFDFVDGLYIGNMCDCSFPICSTFSHNMEWLLATALQFMDDAMRRELPFFLYFAPTPAHLPTVEDALLFHSPYHTPGGLLPTYPNVSKYCSSCTLSTRKGIWDSAGVISGASEVGSCRASLAALRWLDESLGVLYDFLSERDAIDNTYVVMSTDHGSAKYSLYELGIRVPLYAAGPGIRAGIRVDEVVSHVDLLPTFLSWAGCCADGGSMPIPTDGLSWSSLASGEAVSLDRPGVRAESYFDRVNVTRDFIKVYTSPTYDIIAHEIFLSDNYTVTNTLEHAAFDLAHFVGDSYPALYDRMQVYNVTADPMEQANLWYEH